MTTMTIYRWIEDGKLPAMQIGKHYRIRSADLENMLEGAKVQADRAIRGVASLRRVRALSNG